MKWTDEALAYCPYKLAGNPPNVAWMAERLGDGLLVDIGASVGAICTAILRQCPGSRCVAFEPQTRAADELENMVAANGVDVELHRNAVGAFVGSTVLKYPSKRSISGWASIAAKPDFYEAENKAADVLFETVQITTLDTWWNEAGCPDVQVLKSDAQGAEVDILLGGKEMLAATAPYLFIECHAGVLGEHGRTEQELFDLLNEMGYDWERFRVNLKCEKRSR